MLARDLVSFLRIHRIGSHGERRERNRNGGEVFPPFSFRNAFLSHCWPLLTSVPPRPKPLPPRSNLSTTLNRCPNNSLSVAEEGWRRGGWQPKKADIFLSGLDYHTAEALRHTRLKRQIFWVVKKRRGGKKRKEMRQKEKRVRQNKSTLAVLNQDLVWMRVWVEPGAQSSFCVCVWTHQCDTWQCDSSRADEWIVTQPQHCCNPSLLPEWNAPLFIAIENISCAEPKICEHHFCLYVANQRMTELFWKIQPLRDSSPKNDFQWNLK